MIVCPAKWVVRLDLALRQGTASAVPKSNEEEGGFSRWRKVVRSQSKAWL